MPSNNRVTLTVDIDDQGSRDLNSIISQLKTLQRESNKAAANTKRLTKEFGNLNNAFSSGSRQAGKFTDNLRRNERQLRDTGRASKASADSVLDMSAALGQVGQSLDRVGDFGARQFGNFIREGAKLERLTASFKNLLGTTEAATTAIDKLYTASETPGLTFEQAAKATQGLSALGVELDRSIALTQAFGNAAEVGGTEAGQFAEGMRQITQIVARGKLEQEDYTAILERFRPSARIAFEEFGASAEEANKKIGTGRENMLQFLEAISDVSKVGKADIDTLSNAQSNFNTAVQRAQATIGTQFVPITRIATNAITGMINGFEKLPDSVQVVVGSLAGLTAIVGKSSAGIIEVGSNIAILSTVLKGSGGLAGAATLATAKLAAFGAAALAAAPLILGVAGAVTAAVFAWRKLNEISSPGVIEFVDEAEEANETLTELAKQTNLVPVPLSRVEGALNKVGPVIEVTAQEMDELANNSRSAGKALVIIDEAARDADPNLTKFNEKVQEAKDLLEELSQTNAQTQISAPASSDLGGNAAETAQAAETLAETAKQANEKVVESTKEAIGELTLDWDHYYTNEQERAQASAEALQNQSAAVVDTQAVINSSIAEKQNLEESAAEQNQTATTSKLKQDKQISKSQMGLVQQLKTTLIPTLQQTSTGFQATGKQGIESFNQLIKVLQRTARAVRAVISAIDSLSITQGSGGIGAGLGLASAAAEASASLSELFHSSVNDRLARLAGQRSVTQSAPVRAVQRENARDFSEHFSRGVQRETQRQAPVQNNQHVVIQLQLNGRTVQELTAEIGRLQQGGRANMLS